MFSFHNDKISNRQFERMLICDLFGAGSMILPALLAYYAGMSGVFCIALATILLLGYVYIIASTVGKSSTLWDGYEGYLVKCWGKASDVILLLYLLATVFYTGYVLCMVLRLVESSMLPNQSTWLTGIVLMVLAGYGLMAGIESRGRLFEVFFWLMFGIVVLFLAISAIDVNIDYWRIEAGSWRGFWIGSFWSVLVPIVPIGFLPLLSGHFGKPEKTLCVMRRGIAMSAALLAVLYLILVGCFQVGFLQVLEHPVLTLASVARVPGGFLQRQDALIGGVWLFFLFSLLESGMYYQIWCMRHITGLPVYQPFVWVAAIGTLLVGKSFMKRQPLTGLGDAEQSLGIFVIGFVIVLPLLNLIVEKTKINRKIVFVLLIIIGMVCVLSGCGAPGIESRSFPLCMSITKEANQVAVQLYFEQVNPQDPKMYQQISMKAVGDNYEDIWKKLEQKSASLIDVSHVKALLFEHGLLGTDFYEQFLTTARLDNQLSYNTIVYAINADAPIDKWQEETHHRLGSYLLLLSEKQSIQEREYQVGKNRSDRISGEDKNVTQAVTLGELYQSKYCSDIDDGIDRLPLLTGERLPEISE